MDQVDGTVALSIRGQEGTHFIFRSAQLPGSTWLLGPLPNLQQSKRKHFCFNSGLTVVARDVARQFPM